MSRSLRVDMGIASENMSAVGRTAMESPYAAVCSPLEGIDTVETRATARCLPSYTIPSLQHLQLVWKAMWLDVATAAQLTRTCK